MGIMVLFLIMGNAGFISSTVTLGGLPYGIIDISGLL